MQDYIQRVQKFLPLGLYGFFTRLQKGFDFSGVRREGRPGGKGAEEEKNIAMQSYHI